MDCNVQTVDDDSVPENSRSNARDQYEYDEISPTRTEYGTYDPMLIIVESDKENDEYLTPL